MSQLRQHQRVKELEALLIASRAVMECNSFEQTARIIFDACCDAVGAVSGYIALLSDDGVENELLFLESGGLPCDVDPDLPMPVRGLRAEAYRTKQVACENDFANSEWLRFMPAGHVHLTNVMFAPLEIDGKIVGVLGLANKPTEFTEDDQRIAQAFGDLAAVALRRTRMEELLREREQNYRITLSSIGDAVIATDAEGRIRMMNPVAQRLTGWTQTAAVGRPLTDVFQITNSLTQQTVDNPVSGVLASGSIEELENHTVLLAQDGREVQIADSAAPIRSDDGQVTGVVLVFRDVTDQHATVEALQLSENKFYKAFNTAPYAITLTEAKIGLISEVNDAFCRISGYAREDAVGRTTVELNLWANDDEREAVVADLVAGRAVNHRELLFRRKDGEIITCKVSAELIHINSELLVLSSIEDITENQRVTHTLRVLAESKFSSETDFFTELVRRLAAFLGVRYALVALIDPDLPEISQTIAVCNNGEIGENFSYSLAGTPCANVASQGPCYYPRDIQDLFPEDKLIVEMQAESYWGTPLRNSAGQVMGILAILDVKPLDHSPQSLALLNSFAVRAAAELERKRSVAALRQSESVHRALVAALPDIVLRFDRQGRHLFASENVLGVTGIPAADFIGKTHRELGFGKHESEFWENALNEVISQGVPLESEFLFEGINGSIVFNWRLIPELNIDNEVQTVLSISRDVTAQHRLAEDYRILFQEMLDGFALHEIVCNDLGQPVDYRFLAVNPAFERLTGLPAEEIIGKTVLEVMPETETYWIEKYGKVALTGESANFEQMSAEIGKHFHVRAFRPATRQFACIFTDITERVMAEQHKQHLEDQIMQMQKIEALGTLAGGIAHDFNNMLFVMLGNAELVKQDLVEGSPAVENIDSLIGAGLRAKDLINKLLIFSRQSDALAVSLDLASSIRETMRMLRRVIPASIELNLSLADTHFPLTADPVEIQQILMNLCMNASHAIEPNPGAIDISLRTIEVDKRVGQAYPEIDCGSFYELSIRDNGCGIAPSVMPKIFNPYFTTKELGRGTGIGLSVVHRIISKMSGAIRVTSTWQAGTTVLILLPAGVATGTTEDSIELALASISGTYLIVDDEPANLAVLERMLNSLGCEAICCSSAQQAWELLQSRPADFDAVITDQSMPQIKGTQLATMIKGANLNVRVILYTGYGDSISATSLAEAGIDRLLSKPLTLRDLAAALSV